MRIANYRRSARARGRCARIAFRDLAAIQPPRFKGTDPSTTLVSDATNPEQGRMGTGEGVLSICISPLERYLSGSVSISSFSSWKTCKTQVPIWLYRWTIHVPFPSWSEISLEIYIYIYIYISIVSKTMTQSWNLLNPESFDTWRFERNFSLVPVSSITFVGIREQFLETFRTFTMIETQKCDIGGISLSLEDGTKQTTDGGAENVWYLVTWSWKGNDDERQQEEGRKIQRVYTHIRIGIPLRRWSMTGNATRWTGLRGCSQRESSEFVGEPDLEWLFKVEPACN